MNADKRRFEEWISAYLWLSKFIRSNLKIENNGRTAMHMARALAIGMVAALFIVSFTVTGVAASVLSNSEGGSWKYHKEITVSNSGDELSDYQVPVRFTSGNFPTNARSNGADIRFTDVNEKELSYWIETWDYSGKNALVWVKVPIIPSAASITVRMWYGNPAASSSSNGDATFEFFDDFEGTSLNLKKWTYSNQGTISISNSKLSLTGVTPIISSVPTFPMMQNMLESKLKEPGVSYVKNSVGSNTALGWSGPGYESCTPSCISAQHYYSYGGAIWMVNSNGAERYVPRNELYNNYDVLGINVVSSNIVDFYKNYVKVYSLSPQGGIETSNAGIFMLTQLLGGDYLYVDWVRVRKYAAQEPIISLSAEQSRAGLIAEYHFDGDAKDSSGNGNDGTIYGAIFGDGIKGKALSFNGLNNYVDIPNSGSGLFNFGQSGSFSVEAFVKFNTLNQIAMIASKFKGSTPQKGYYLWIYNSESNIQFEITDGTVASSADYATSNFMKDKWYHLVGVRDVANDKLRLYVDGIEIHTSTDITTEAITNTENFKIGAGATTFFSGAIDEVRIYNRALSAEEIKANYDSIIGNSPATTATKFASAPTSLTTPAPTTAPIVTPDSSNPYIYAGAGGMILLLLAVIVMKRRGSSKKPEPVEKEIIEESQMEEDHSEIKTSSMQTIESTTLEISESKPAPVPDIPQKPAVIEPPPEGIFMRTAFGYKGAIILYKVKIENNTPEPISDIRVYPYVPDVFLLKDRERSIALIEPRSSQTVTFEIRPTGECGDCNVSGRVNYYDGAAKKRKDIELESKSLSIVCPMLRRKEIGDDAWRELVSDLIKAEETTTDIPIEGEGLFSMISEILKDMNLFALAPVITRAQQIFRGTAKFYGEGVKGFRYAAQIEVVGGMKKSKLILKTWAEKEEALTGFYHGILDEIEKRVKVKEYIDSGIINYNLHIGDKIGNQVKDSFVQHSTIGAGARKCPNCRREVETNEKFCLECGAKL